MVTVANGGDNSGSRGKQAEKMHVKRGTGNSERDMISKMVWIQTIRL